MINVHLGKPQILNPYFLAEEPVEGRDTVFGGDLCTYPLLVMVVCTPWKFPAPVGICGNEGNWIGKPKFTVMGGDIGRERKRNY